MAESRKENIKSSTLKNLLWQFGGNSFQSVIRLGVLAVLARFILPEEYGVVMLAIAILGFFDMLTELGLGPALIQRKEINQDHINSVFVFSLSQGLVFTVALYFLSSPISSFYDMPNLKGCLEVMALVFPLKAFSIVHHYHLMRDLKFKVTAMIDLSAYVLGFGVVAIAMAFLGYGLWSLVGGYLVETVAKTLSYVRFAKIKTQFGLKQQEFKELFYYGGGFAIARFSNFMGRQGADFVIGKRIDSEALGLYGRAYQITTMPIILFGLVLEKVLFSALATIQDNKEKMAQVYFGGSKVLALLTLPVSAFCFVLADEIILILLGPDWSAAAEPFRILSLGMFFRTTSKMGDSVSRATGVVYNRGMRKLVFAITVIVGALVGSRWGISGVAHGVNIALVTNFTLMSDLSLRVIKSNWARYLSIFFTPLLLTLISLIIIIPLDMLLSMIETPALIKVITLGIIFCGVNAYFLVLQRQYFFGQDSMWVYKTLEKAVNSGLRKIKGGKKKNG